MEQSIPSSQPALPVGVKSLLPLSMSSAERAVVTPASCPHLLATALDEVSP